MIPNYNTEKAITSFSLGDLNRMAGRETAPGWMDECIVATSGTRMREFRYPCRIDAYIIGVGAEGETIQTFNLKEYRLKKDTLFIFPPKNILYRTDSGDTFNHFARPAATGEHRHETFHAAAVAVRRTSLPGTDSRGEPDDARLHCDHRT